MTGKIFINYHREDDLRSTVRYDQLLDAVQFEQSFGH
jgi:hypothetical protein